MNGLHIPGTPLVVDYWRQKNVPPRALFFLSHLHADHTCGLTSNWPYHIHCTPLTARLLLNKFKIRPDLIVELEIGESRLLHVVGPTERVSVSVTVLDANHCPGSAMFIFEGYFGRILYTGDFRYSPTMSALSQLVQSRPVDLLYLDNTYCHKSCIFPPRETVTEEIINLIRGNKDGMTILGLHTLGKEDLLVAIAKSLGVWVGVAPGRYETLRLIEAENVFTTDVDSCFVRVLPFHVALRSGLTITPEDEDSVLVILPTCIFSGDSAPPTPTHPNIKVVPYSDHSSFKELMEFVGVVKPRCIRPIVRSFSGNKSDILSSRCDMSVFDRLLDPTPLTSYEVPALVSQLFTVGCQDDRPRPSSSLPSVRRSLEGRSHGRRRKRASGVNFLSPRKESHDYHVTEVEAAKGNGSLTTEDGNGSHDPRVTQDTNGLSHDPHVTVSTRKSEENVKHVITTKTQDLPSETEPTVNYPVPVKTERVNGIDISTKGDSDQNTPHTPKSVILAGHRHILLEQRLSSVPKPDLTPVEREFSQPRRFPSVRSEIFYGTDNSGHSRTRKRRCDSEKERVVVPLDIGGRGSKGKREIPSTLTRPVWVTGLERGLGVDLGERGGGKGGKEEGREEGERNEGGGGEVKVERRDVTKSRGSLEEAKKRAVVKCETLPVKCRQVTIEKHLAHPLTSTINELAVSIPFLPDLPPLLDHSTESCDGHVTLTLPNPSVHEDRDGIVFDYIDRLLFKLFP